MISKLLEIMLAISSISPVFLSLWFNEFNKTGNLLDGIFWIILFLVFTFITVGIIEFSKRKLEIMPVRIKSIAPADKEVAAFLAAYILPLIITDISGNILTVIFILVLLFTAIYTTSNYHFNPILSIFGYHFYEISVEDIDANGNIYTHTYVLMTKKTIRHCKDVKRVVQISDYMLMEVE